VIRPLYGYVVRAEAADRVAAPVAEDLAPGQMEQIIDTNPASSLQLFADTPDARCRARAYIARVTTDGTFGPTESWWIYQIREDGHTQTGVVAEVAVAAYDSGRVLRHEHTVAEVASHVADTLEQVGGTAHPVSLLYRHRSAVDDVVRDEIAQPPDIHVAQGDRIQRAWQAKRPEALATALEGITTLYIADGHHRSAGAAALAHRSTAVAGDGRAYLLAVLFPDDQMKTLSYHRCLRLPNRSPRQILAAVAERLGVRAIARPGDDDEPSPGEVWVAIEHQWLSVRLPESAGDGPTSTLDAARLQHQVLGPICDVADPRADPRLTYVPGSSSYAELATMCAARRGIAFVTRAASVAEVMAVSDAGGIMPPKSTWFTPKIGAGLFLRRLDG
jgi:uncharacterized protein (DUF1015 family)